MNKILYVEDDQLISRLYTQKLAEAGFEVTAVEDGLAAIRKLSEYTPDLVVLDLLMPKMTGADVLKFMRQRPDLRSVRVVVFSNSFLSNLTEQVSAAKVEMTLVKSAVTPRRLIDALNQVLQGPPHQLAELAPESSPFPTTPAALEAPVPTTPAPAPVTANENASEFQGRVQKEFFERTPVIIKSVRELCAGFLDAVDPVPERRRLEDLARKIGFLSQMTSLAGCHHLAQLSSAIEALLFELHDQPAKINDSTRQTVVAGIAFLVDQLDSVDKPEPGQPPPATILVVDDDAVSNRAVVLALGRAKLQATSLADPFDALKKLETNPFDLVLLDVEMPGMTGITLCEKMRGLPLHRRTPVIFVTSLRDFKTRARTLLSGATDLITKPILPLELTVKAITQLMRNPKR